MSEAEQTGGSVSKRLRNNFVTASSDVSGASPLIISRLKVTSFFTVNSTNS